MSDMYENRPDFAPTDERRQAAYDTLRNKVLVVLHDRAERIVLDILNPSNRFGTIATVERLNDRVIYDIEGKESDFAQPCTPAEILYVLGDDLPDNDRELPRQGDAPIDMIQALALHAYYVGIYQVLRSRYGMTDVDGPIFDADSPAGFTHDDAVSSILRHELGRYHRVAASQTASLTR